MMERLRLGTSDINISPISVGTWAMGGGDSWGESDENLSIETIHRALELGVNFLDTAPAYGNGFSEELVGKALKGKRSDCVLATKCGLVWGADDEGSVHKSRDGVVVRRNLSPNSLSRQVEASLKRLGTDYIDLLLTHWQSVEPFFTPIEETVQALEKLKQEGKIRSYGACNVSVDQLKEYQLHGNPVLIQERFSLLSRSKLEVLKYCEGTGLTFQAYSPLERGVLTGKAALQNQVVGSAKASVPWYEEKNRGKMMMLLDVLEEMATKYQCSVGNLAIAWTRQASPAMNVLCGARKPFQIEDNRKGASLSMSIDDWLTMDALAQKLI